MPPTLPDDADAWADCLQTRVNDSEDFAAAADGFDATFRFHVRPDQAYDGQALAFTVVVTDGACVAARGSDADTEYDFALSGPYLAWKALLEGEIEVTAAVTGGEFDLQGSTIALMNNREAVAELVRAAQSVDTEFAV